MKKIIYIIGFILIVIGLYENMNRMSDSKDKVLHIWVSREEYDVLKEVNPIFESLHQAQIKMQIVSSEQVISTLPLYTASLEYPDVITASHTLISELVSKNAISPISEVFETFNILPIVMSGFKVKGEYYGIPYNAQTDILFYDQEIYPEGISSFYDFDEDSEMSLVMDYQNIYHINPFITGFGGYTIGVDNFGDTHFYDIGINKEESVQGLSTMLGLLNKTVIYDDEFDIYQSFINKEANLMIAPASLITLLEQVYPSLGYQAIPNFKDDLLPYTYMKIDTYQVTKLSKNKELAIEYLRFLLTEDVAALRYEKNQSIAPVDYENIISQDAYYGVVKKQLHRSVPLPNQAEFSYLYRPFAEAATHFLVVPNQIQKIMDDTVNQINEELENIMK